MGSGEFAEKGFGRAACIHNIVYFDSNRGSHDYTAGSGIQMRRGAIIGMRCLAGGAG
jgi:hypothetical protein